MIRYLRALDENRVKHILMRKFDRTLRRFKKRYIKLIHKNSKYNKKMNNNQLLYIVENSCCINKKKEKILDLLACMAQNACFYYDKSMGESSNFLSILIIKYVKTYVEIQDKIGMKIETKEYLKNSNKLINKVFDRTTIKPEIKIELLISTIEIIENIYKRGESSEANKEINKILKNRKKSSKEPLIIVYSALLLVLLDDAQRDKDNNKYLYYRIAKSNLSFSIYKYIIFLFFSYEYDCLTYIPTNEQIYLFCKITEREEENDEADKDLFILIFYNWLNKKEHIYKFILTESEEEKEGQKIDYMDQFIKCFIEHKDDDLSMVHKYFPSMVFYKLMCQLNTTKM